MSGMQHEHPEPYSPLPLVRPRICEAIAAAFPSDDDVRSALVAIAGFERLIGLARLCIDNPDAQAGLLEAVSNWANADVTADVVPEKVPSSAPMQAYSATRAKTTAVRDRGEMFSTTDIAGSSGDGPPAVADPPGWERLFSLAPLVDLLIALTYATLYGAEALGKQAGGVLKRVEAVASTIDAAESAVSARGPRGDSALRAGMNFAAHHIQCDSPGECENPRHGQSRAAAFAAAGAVLLRQWLVANPIAALVAGEGYATSRELTRAIDSMAPVGAQPGSAVSLRAAAGRGFGAEQPSSVVVLGSDGHTVFPVTAWSEDVIEVTVPDGAPSGPVFFGVSLSSADYADQIAAWSVSLREFAHTVLPTFTHFPPRRPDPCDECEPDTLAKRGLTILTKPFVADAYLRGADGVRLDDPLQEVHVREPLTVCWRVEQNNPATTVEILDRGRPIATGLPPAGSFALPTSFDYLATALGLTVHIEAGWGPPNRRPIRLSTPRRVRRSSPCDPACRRASCRWCQRRTSSRSRFQRARITAAVDGRRSPWWASGARIHDTGR